MQLSYSFVSYCFFKLSTLNKLSAKYARNIDSKRLHLTAMPKDKHLADLKEARQKKSAKNALRKARYPPSEIYLSVLGNGAASSARSLYMFTDQERYVFNCGEGSQRLAQEHKMKFAKLNNIFITHNSWKNLGGLLGLSLTIQDIGVSELTIHGPPDLDLLYKYSSPFAYMKDLNIVTKSIDEPFQDDCMEVQYIPITKETSITDSSNSENCQEDSLDHKSKKIRLSDSKSTDIAVAFACKGHKRLGHLLLDKCAEAGVPVGPLLGELKNGKDITLPSGKTVFSRDVLSPEEICTPFLVVECPNEGFLSPFVNESKFHQYQSNSSSPSDIAALVVHFTPPEIMRTSQYQTWIHKFPDSTCHLVLNDDCSTLNSLALHRIQHHLNLLCPNIFPLLQENKAAFTESTESAENIFYAKTSERYYLRPSKGLQRYYALEMEPSEFIAEAMNISGFNDSLKGLQNNINRSAESSENGENSYPEVVFLGTGSCIPCKVRNVSAILINVDENKSMLLDCGEGTNGQLLRFYGSQHPHILSSLSSIFISHIHADHHLGVIEVLLERKKAFNKLQKEFKPLYIIGPKRLSHWLKNYSITFTPLWSLYRFIECSSLKHDSRSEETNSTEKKEYCSDFKISTVPVDHCHDAHAAILISKSLNCKLVYSGDTVPCEDLIVAGKDCSLLIHEATMEDELAAEAALKKHCTTSEAIKVGEKMNAEYTILTHFSQRYAKVPLFNENFHNHVGIAFDNMRVRPKDLHVLPLMIPALKQLFAEEFEVMIVRRGKRQRKLALLADVLHLNDSPNTVDAEEKTKHEI